MAYSTSTRALHSMLKMWRWKLLLPPYTELFNSILAANLTNLSPPLFLCLFFKKRSALMVKVYKNSYFGNEPLGQCKNISVSDLLKEGGKNSAEWFKLGNGSGILLAIRHYVTISTLVLTSCSRGTGQYRIRVVRSIFKRRGKAVSRTGLFLLYHLLRC